MHFVNIGFERPEALTNEEAIPEMEDRRAIVAALLPTKFPIAGPEHCYRLLTSLSQGGEG